MKPPFVPPYARQAQGPNKPGELSGVVTETLPNTMFRVDVGDKVILTYLSGKMRVHKIKVMIGDRVVLELDQYGERGRIVRRM
ncbi:MAG: translation initiation factor IF-1 [Parcubacteria group bacterium RIFOXYD2_FULL_52_8]|nr:MAG: translation initiation factor IF-1 [Parcubacteria group bacterium RIFOXYD2_FULL_52_8]